MLAQDRSTSVQTSNLLEMTMSLRLVHEDEEALVVEATDVAGGRMRSVRDVGS